MMLWSMGSKESDTIEQLNMNMVSTGLRGAAFQG